MRTRTIVLLLGIGATLATTAVVGVGLAGASTTPAPTSSAIVALADTGNSIESAGAFVHGDETVTVGRATVTEGITFAMPGASRTTVTLTPPTGQRLAPGVYDGTGATATKDHAGLRVTRGGRTVDAGVGEFDVLTLTTSSTASGTTSGSTNAAGTISGIDVVFRSDVGSAVASTFGEFRMGLAEPAVRLGADHVAFPPTPVWSNRIWFEESVRNTSDAPVRIGAPTFSGTAAEDYVTTAANSCTGTLAAGASCTFRIGFSPTGAGPRNATLRLPVDGTTRTVDLAGSAALGETELTTAHDAWVTVPSTTHRDGPWQVVTGPTGAIPVVDGVRTYTWGVAAPYGGAGPGTSVSLSVPADAAAPADAAPAPGKHTIGALGNHAGLGLGFAVNGKTCDVTKSTGTPSVTIGSFVVDDSGALVSADLRWTTNCDRNPRQVEKGQIVWRAHGDTVAPDPVTQLHAPTTGSVRWDQSTSSDLASDVARIVPGDGSGATPTSGIALTNDRTTSAALPELVPGQLYTVLVWAVDWNGNTSAPTTIQVTG